MIEEIEDAFAFHQARDKIKGRFSILNTELPRAVGLGQRVFEVRKAQIRKNLLDDIGRGLVLKNLVALIHGQQPEPRINLGKISSKARGISCLREAADNAVHILLVASAGQLNRNGYVLSDNLREIDRRILREQLQMVMEQPRNPLFTLKALENEFIRTQRGR